MQIDCSDIGQRVVMVYSLPRVHWTANFACAMSVSQKLGLRLWHHSSAFWSKSLEVCLRDVSDKGYDYALTVDFDSIFTINDVACLYAMMKSRPDIDALAPVQAKRNSAELLMAMRDNDGVIPEVIDGNQLRGSTVKACIAHFGLTMIRLSALKDVPRPWFLRIPDPDKPGESIDDDIYFWREWERRGKSLHIASQVSIGHVEESVTWIGNGLETINQRWGDFEKNGRPKTARNADHAITQKETDAPTTPEGQDGAASAQVQIAAAWEG